MLDLKQIEAEIRQYWKKIELNKKITSKKGKKYFLLDGPPYANFIPHVGHIKNTVFKDLLIRKASMQGHEILFQPGFDTHGLPVENMIEKKIGLKSKKDIEKFGVAKFMKECKDGAALNKDLWMNAYDKLGSLYATKEPYLTYENSYIDSAWWAFAEMYKKGIVYEGEKPVMWCPHCETSLAGYEVTDSYKDVTDPGVYVLFKLEDSDEHLLVYTTTPWTLPANVAVAVAPDKDYALVDVGGKKVIIAEERLEKLSELELGYSVLKTLKGKSLVGKKYEPLLDVPLQQELSKGKLGKAHEVIASIPLLKERVASKLRTKKNVEGEDLFEEFVTTKEGTGFVHTAPGHGKTDNYVGQKYGLACVSPLDDHCEFTEEAGFTGFVKKADRDIIDKLKDDGKLLAEERVTHSYPLCWRCKSPLIFRLSNQLFFKVDKIKKTIKKENKKVKWYPGFARDRFDNWVENAEDWNISRQRYWGIPIPIWRSEDGDELIIGSSKELEKISGKKIEDLHTVENIVIEKKGKKFKKMKGILDVWFDSGVAPWASLGYPHKNKKLFEDNFPISRINEAQDQIRGWFYSLMFCSAGTFEKAPYKEVSMTGWVLDRNGNKMSKSQGNVVTAEKALDELGSDILRYYFCWDTAPYETQKFNLDIAKKEIGRILNILWNLKNLVKKGKVNAKDIEDKWIISKLESMTQDYLEDMDNFEFQSAMRGLSNFILNDLSRRYIQITREKENGEIISHCLERLLKLLAPVSLFTTEKIWQDLKEIGIVKEESVHLCGWPKSDKKKIDSKLEEEFENMFLVIEKGLSSRDRAQIGLRWPLSKAKVKGGVVKNKELIEIIKRQLNVKAVEFGKGKDEIEVELDTKMTPELEAEGFAREVARKVQVERKKEGMKKGDLIDLELYVDSDLKDMLEKHNEFLMERTNSKKIDFIVDKMDEKAIECKVKGKIFGIIFL